MSELDEKVSALATDLDARMENLEAIKGKGFAEAVKLSVNMATIMQVGSSNLPHEMREMIVPDMCAMHIVQVAKALGLDKDQTKEMADFAKSISDQIKAESARLRPLFDKEFGDE